MGHGQLRFAFECPRTWESLAETNDTFERWCDGCAKPVVLCDSLDEAQGRSRRGQCIALVTQAMAPRRERRNPAPPTAPVANASKTVGVLLTEDADQGTPQVSWLVPLDGARAGETFRLGAVTAVGGAPPADVVLPDPGVAALHARFETSIWGCKVLVIGDAEIFVNDRQVTRMELCDNDIIRLGSTRLVLKSVS